MSSEDEKSKAFKLFMTKLEEQANARAQKQIDVYKGFVKDIFKDFSAEIKSFSKNVKLLRRSTKEMAKECVNLNESVTKQSKNITKLSNVMLKMEKAISLEIKKPKKKPKSFVV